MVFSNSEILNAIENGYIVIDPPPEMASFDKPNSPFNTTALDLRLGNTISIPKEDQPFVYDLRKGGIAAFLKNSYETHAINPIGGFALEPGKFVLSNTLERVHFPAPTIHAGFDGTITLELMNFGKNSIMLYPEIYICQLIFEKVFGKIVFSASQFQGQVTPEGK